MNSYKTLFIPVYFFVFLWIFLFFLLREQLYYYYPVSFDTYLLIFLNIFSLISGVIIFSKTTKLNHVESYFTIDQKRETILYKSLRISILINLVGFILVYREVSLHFDSYTYYFQNPIRIRMFFNEINNNPLMSVSVFFKLGSYFVNLGQASAIFTGLLYGITKKHNLFAIGSLVFLLLCSVLTFSRYFFMSILGYFLLTLSVSSALITNDDELKKKSKQKLVTFAGISVLLVFGAVYGIFRARTFVVKEVSDLFFKQLYFYFVAGVPSLHQYLLEDVKLEWGASTFRGIVKWMARFGMADALSVQDSHHDFVKITTDFTGNTYTFVKSLYADFGYFGSLLMSFIWGGLYSIFVRKVIQQKSFIYIILTCILGFGMIMSFFNLYFEGFTVLLYWILYAVILFSYVKNKYNS